MFRAVATEEGTVLVPLTEDEIAARVAEEQAAANAPPVVPQLIEMRKAILEMDATPFGGGTLTDAVEALVAASPLAVQREWARGTLLSRSRDIVLGMQAALGIDDATMDALFIAANARP